MAAVDFPTSPTDGQQFTAAGATYRYNATAQAWIIVSTDLGLYAPIDSPTLTGDPKAPTPGVGDNDTSIATTAFVKSQGYATTAQVALKADLASPTLTGDPKAPTPLTADNDTSIATTAFVKAQGYVTGGPYQLLDPTLTALAGLDTSVGVVEQTGTDAFAKRAIGVTAGTSIPTRADGDARWQAAGSYQAQDATLTALAGLNTTAGLVEQTGVDTFTKRAIGVAAATDVLTRGDGDGRYATPASVTSALAPYALLASPTLTGDPKAPTPATADNDTSIATTAFVKAQGYVTSSGVTSVTGTAPVVSSGGATPAISMPAAASGVSGHLTAADWATFNGKAPLASPAFTGTPTAPTAAPGTNTTQLASTAFVAAAIAAGGGSASISVGNTPPGSPASGALWWHTDLGQLYIYYNDGNTSQWVPASPAVGAVPISAADVLVYLQANATINSGVLDLVSTGLIGAAGQKWEIEGVALIQNGSAAATTAGVSIFDGASTLAGGGGVMGWAVVHWGVTSICKAHKILTAPTNFTLRGHCNAAGAYATPNGQGGFGATYISARRLY